MGGMRGIPKLFGGYIRYYKRSGGRLGILKYMGGSPVILDFLGGRLVICRLNNKHSTTKGGVKISHGAINYVPYQPLLYLLCLMTWVRCFRRSSRFLQVTKGLYMCERIGLWDREFGHTGTKVILKG